jgi:hypothetical protein
MPRHCSRNCWARAARSTAAPCVLRWRPPSAPPTRTAHGSRGLTRLAGRIPPQTRRSEESEHFQQDAYEALEADALPIGVVMFPGSGISANLANKAKKLGIPVWRFTADNPV